MKVDIARAGVEDWQTLRDVRLRALAEAPHAFGSTLDREMQFAQEDWVGRLAAGRTFFARDGDHVVGLASYYEEKGRTGERQLVSMWVDPAARGSGAGPALVTAVRAAAAAEGAHALTLFVADGNDRARRFYERLGFRTTGERQSLPSDPCRGEERYAVALP